MAINKKSGKDAHQYNQTQLRIPPELKVRLEELAQADGRSFNNMVVKLISDFVDKKSKH
jgi:predicted DNA-binding protein